MNTHHTKKFFWKDQSGRGYTNTFHSIDELPDTDINDSEQTVKEWAVAADEGDEWNDNANTFICIEGNDYGLDADLESRIDAAVQSAQFDFWAKIVEHFPAIHTGDFPPDATMRLDSELNKAVTLWYGLNSDSIRPDNFKQIMKIIDKENRLADEG